MPPPCMRCGSRRSVNLETARNLGTAAGGLIGSLKGAYVSLYHLGKLPLATTARFPLSRIASAVIAGASGGIAGATAGNQLIRHLLPPGEGAPWLCLGCGHAFRVLS